MHVCIWFYFVFRGVIVDFNLALPFVESHGVMGFFYLVDLDCQIFSKLSWAVSRKIEMPRNPLTDNGGIHGKP